MTRNESALPPLHLDEFINRNWLRDLSLTVSQWADEHRVLDPLFTNEHGPWSTKRVPYAREPMDAAADPWVRQVTIMGPTQIGKSEIANNILGFYLQHRPSPAMFVLPNVNASKLAARKRVRPMILASPALSAEMTENRHDFATRDITLRRSSIYMRSAESPTELAAVAVRLVLGDETEKWPKWSGSEANPLSLVRERTRTFYDHVIVLTSTPKVRGGIIDREFERGDQRRYHVQCPHCQKWIVFEWAHVTWDNENVSTPEAMQEAQQAWYQCQHCGGKVDDLQKSAMISRGEWVPRGRDAADWISTGRASDRSEHRSYHLWAAYSPWLTWWRIVAEFLRSKNEPSDMMNFVNSWLAEVWEDRVQNTSDAAVRACIDARPARECPDEVLVVTGAVDVQKDRLEWCVQGWGLDEESWVLDAGRIPLMANGGDWEQLGNVLFRSTWGKHMLRSCFIDSRGGGKHGAARGDEVLDFVRRWHPVAVMIAGVERDSPEQFAPKKVDRHPRTGAVLQQSLTLWTVNVGWFKDLVAARIAKATAEPDSKAGRIHLPSDLPEGWLDQITSEHKVRERKGNREVDRWVLKPGHLRNEAWDLLIYNAACARHRYVNTLVSPARLPERVQNRAAKPAAQQPRPRRPGGGYPSFGGRP